MPGATATGRAASTTARIANTTGTVPTAGDETPAAESAAATESTAAASTTLDRVGPGGGVASDSAFGVALVSLWQQVAEAGGPVGFPPPVVRSEIAATAAPLVDGVKTGRVIAVAANQARRLIGVGFLRLGRGQQVRTGRIELLLVHPAHTRAGLGSSLLSELVDMARTQQVRQLDVVVQDGAGLTDFFAGFGFTEWGRWPNWVEFAATGDQTVHHCDQVLLGAAL